MSVKLSSGDFTPLPPAIGRALVDKCYQKRKCAALEIQRIVEEYASANQHDEIFKILKLFGGDLAYSQNANTRKGGLIGLASVAIALQQEACQYMHELILPALASFHHSDSSVQFHACESVFNIVKVVRFSVLSFFTEVFDGLNKLMVHPDEEVRSAAGVLDRLLKDIVTESPSFDLVAFLPQLRQRIYSVNILARYFILSWIEVLDSVPDSGMLKFLPEIMDGLMKMLEDENAETSKLCQNILAEFLEDLHHQKDAVNFKSLVNILVIHSQTDCELARSTALTWLAELCTLSPVTMLPHLGAMLIAVLPSLAFNVTSPKNCIVGEAGAALNSCLYDLVQSTDEEDLASLLLSDDAENLASDDSGTDSQSATISCSSEQLELASVLQVLLQYMDHAKVQTRVAVLKWIDHLLLKLPGKTFQHVPLFFHQLLQALLDPSEGVVFLALNILREIATYRSGREIDMTLFEKKGHGLQPVPSALHHITQTCQGVNEFFPHLMVELERFFQIQPQLFEDRGSFIVRHLAISLGAEAIFSSLAEIVLEEKDVTFAVSMVRSLNIILLTATELFELRAQLQSLKTKESRALFCRLYRCWCHSPVATLSLCYLTQNYTHACLLLKHFSDVEITLDILKEMDKLVQLLESPVFAYLRLDLLDRERSGELVQSLYGLLMLLPQSDAFTLLKCRLECIPPFTFASSSSSTGFRKREEEERRDRGQMWEIPFQELLEHFMSVQAVHRQARKEAQAVKLQTVECFIDGV